MDVSIHGAKQPYILHSGPCSELGWWGLRFAPAWLLGQSIDRAQLGPPDVPIGMFARLLAALIMRLCSKEGLRGSLGLKRSWRVYTAAYFLPLMLGTAAFAFNHVTGLSANWLGFKLSKDCAPPIALQGNVLSELSSPRHIFNGSPFVINPLGIPTTLLLFAAGVVLLVRHSRQRAKPSG